MLEETTTFMKEITDAERWGPGLEPGWREFGTSLGQGEHSKSSLHSRDNGQRGKENSIKWHGQGMQSPLHNISRHFSIDVDCSVISSECQTWCCVEWTVAQDPKGCTKNCCCWWGERDRQHSEVKSVLGAGPGALSPNCIPQPSLFSHPFVSQTKVKGRWWHIKTTAEVTSFPGVPKKGFYNSANCQPRTHSPDFHASISNEPLRLSVELDNENMQKQHICQIIMTWRIKHTQMHVHTQMHTLKGEGAKGTCPGFVEKEYPMEVQGLTAFGALF